MIKINQDKVAEIQKQEQISQAKAYLSSTDWIVTKANEASVQGLDTSAMLIKYAAVLAERQSARELINELEQQL